MSPWLITASVVSVLLGVSAQSQAASERVLVKLDGTAIRADVQSLDTGGELALSNGRTVPLMGLRRIETAKAVEGPPLRSTRLYLRDQSMLIVRSLRVATGQVTFDWAYGKNVTLPIDQVAGVLLAPLGADEDGQARPEPAFAEALARRIMPSDRLFAFTDEGITTVDGLLDGVTAEQVAFVWNDQRRTIGRERVYGLTLARAGKPTDHTGQMLIYLSDGSMLWGRAEAIDPDRVVIQSSQATWALRWADVARIDIQSDRMRFLSEMDPAQVNIESLFVGGALERDRNFMRRPIELAGRQYEKGLGMHSPVSVTYDLDGRFDWLVATIGIDDQTDGRGDCLFKVEVDGQVRLSQRMTGSDKPHYVRVNVSGARQLRLVVEAGADYDLADHANWADARLIRQP